MAGEDNNRPISSKRLKLKDLSNENGNMNLKSPEDSPLSKAEAPITDNNKISGNGTNGLLVYSRMKHGNHPSPKILELETGNAKRPRIDHELRPHDDRYWKERFDRLQMSLKEIDEKSLEKNMNVLRSLSAADRSRFAYELEKSAQQLKALEEIETERGRSLNILGKPLLDRTTSIPVRVHSHIDQVSEKQ